MSDFEQTESLNIANTYWVALMHLGFSADEVRSFLGLNDCITFPVVNKDIALQIIAVVNSFRESTTFSIDSDSVGSI